MPDSYSTPVGKATVHLLHQLCFVALPVTGGIAGFIGYINAVRWLAVEPQEPIRSATLSYGQTAGLVSLPICAALGILWGLAAAFLIVRQQHRAFNTLITASLGGAFLILSLWILQIAEYGRDPSERVLYWTPFALSILTGLAAVPLRKSRTSAKIDGCISDAAINAE